MSKYNKNSGTAQDCGIRLQMTVLLYLLYEATQLHHANSIHSYCFERYKGKFFCRLWFNSSSFIFHTKYKQKKKTNDNSGTNKNGKLSINYKQEQKMDESNNKSKRGDKNKNKKNKKDRNFSLIEAFENYQLVNRDKSQSTYVLFTNASISLQGYEERKDIFIEAGVNGNNKVYNIFNTYGNTSSCFRINPEMIDDLARKICGQINSAHSQDVIPFLENIIFVENQPDYMDLREKVKCNIKQEYSISDGELERRFPILEDRMQTWWKKQNEQLNQSTTFIADSLKLCFTFDVHDSVKHFTGRNKEFNDIFRYHFGSPEYPTDDIFQVVAIYGCGGLGKTELVKEYIKRNKHKYDNNIVWIDAKEISQSFNKLANKLGVNCVNDNDILQIYSNFNQRKCLFIFDNVSCIEELQKYLPLKKLHSKPYIIITSRNREWGNDIKHMDLDVLSLDDACSFVCHALDVNQSPSIITLVNTLKRYPLVLSQSIAYINNMYINKKKKVGKYALITEFVTSYENIKDKILQFPDVYAQTAFTTWNVTVNNIQGEKNGLLAKKLLCIMAYMSPLNIQMEMFYNLDSKNNVVSAMKLLVKYSMVNFLKASNVFGVHEVVQEVFKMKSEDKEMEILDETLSLFITINISNINHAVTAWKYSSKYPDVIQKYKNLCSVIAETMFNTFLFNEGVTFCIQAMDILSNFYGTSYDVIIKTKKVLGKIYMYQSKYDDALRVYEEVKNMESKHYRAEDERVYDTGNSIALVKRHKGEYEVALKMFEDLLQKELKHLGGNNPVTLATRDEIAVIHQHRGMYEESLKQHKNIYKIRFKKLEKECEEKGLSEIQYDNAILLTMDNIALICNFLCNYIESEEWFKKILAIKRKFLNENDPSIFKTLNNLGVLYIRQGRFKEALQVFHQRLNKLREFYKDTSSSIIINIYNISLIMYYQKEYNEALKMCEANLSNSIKLFSHSHIKTLQIEQLKGDILCGLKKYADALVIFNSILQKAKETINDGDTMETLQVRNSIGCVFLGQGNLKDAITQFNEVRRMKVNNFGESHAEVLRTDHCLGLVYKAQGKLIKAFNAFDDVYKKRLALLGENHYETIESKTQASVVRDMMQKSIFRFYYLSDRSQWKKIIAFVILLISFIIFLVYTMYTTTFQIRTFSSILFSQNFIE